MQDDAGLVERIAHSLWNATDHHSPWGEIVALYETTHNEYLTMARSALAAIEAAGWVLVPKPVEFTADQLNAIVRTAIEHAGENMVPNPAFRSPKG